MRAILSAVIASLILVIPAAIAGAPGWFIIGLYAILYQLMMRTPDRG